MDHKIRIALIGCGNIGAVHANAYRAEKDRAEIVACCDVNRERGEAFAARFGIPAFYTDMEEMLAEVRPDAVSVCTWNSAHAPATVCSLRAGAHVLCEKPMAMNTAEALEMERAADQTGKLLMVGFVRRFGNDAAFLKPVIEAKEMGDLYYAKAQYLRGKGYPAGWFGDLKYAGGGPFIDLGVHVIDLVRYLAGNPLPVSAYGVTCRSLSDQRRAWGGGWKSEGVGFAYDCEDSASAIITFENGLRLLVETSYSLDIPEEVNRIELYGTKKSAFLDPSLSYISYPTDNTPRIEHPECEIDGQVFFSREIAHFLDCIEHGTPCRAPARDGVELMRILDAVYESAKTGQTVKIR